MSTMNPAMPTASPTPRLSRLDRLLPAWIFVAMAIGVALGKLFPNIDDDLNRVKVAAVSVPIAIGLL